MTRLANTLLEAHHAQREVVKLKDKLVDQDVAWVSFLPPMLGLQVLGSPYDDTSPTARFLGEAVDLGFLQRTDVPEFKYNAA